MKDLTRKLALATAAVSLSVGLVSCNERDLAIGAGAIGGAILVGSAYDNSYGRDYRYSRGYYDDGNGYWDRYDGRYYRNGGRWYRDGRYQSRGSNNNRSSMEAMAVQTVNFAEPINLTTNTSSKNPTADVAAKYRIGRNAATAVVTAFESVRQTGRLEALKEIGLEDQDLRGIASGTTPGESAVQKMAARLNASPASVKALMIDVQDEYSLMSQGEVAVR